jgi:hypothetical protein
MSNQTVVLDGVFAVSSKPVHGRPAERDPGLPISRLSQLAQCEPSAIGRTLEPRPTDARVIAVQPALGTVAGQGKRNAPPTTFDDTDAPTKLGWKGLGPHRHFKEASRVL